MRNLKSWKRGTGSPVLTWIEYKRSNLYTLISRFLVIHFFSAINRRRNLHFIEPQFFVSITGTDVKDECMSPKTVSQATRFGLSTVYCIQKNQKLWLTTGSQAVVKQCLNGPCLCSTLNHWQANLKHCLDGQCRRSMLGTQGALLSSILYKQRRTRREFSVFFCLYQIVPISFVWLILVFIILCKAHWHCRYWI